MSKERSPESVYCEAGYWWWRNPFTGTLEGAFQTRKQARERRKEAFHQNREQKKAEKAQEQSRAA